LVFPPTTSSTYTPLKAGSFGVGNSDGGKLIVTDWIMSVLSDVDQEAVGLRNSTVIVPVPLEEEKGKVRPEFVPAEVFTKFPRNGYVPFGAEDPLNQLLFMLLV